MAKAGEPIRRDAESEKNYRIDGSNHIHEALGFMKDWVTSVLQLQTAIIGAIAAAAALKDKPDLQLSFWQAMGVSLTSVAFLFSIGCGVTILNMLPAADQLVPITDNAKKSDVFSMHTYGRITINASASWSSDRRSPLKIVGLQAGVLGNPGQHLRPIFGPIVEGEHIVGPSLPHQYAVGTGLSLDVPPDPLERPKDFAGRGGGPIAHARVNSSRASGGIGSPWSTRSASTRNASATVLLRASVSVSPYASTPGIASTSPIHRPSVSRSISILSMAAILANGALRTGYPRPLFQ